ncbi:DoxX family membrane protein [Azohydromonas lata]|uniref:DoxX family membrane protein n=1 Tax=Azohydromonas lata TaxID=45677 RepID=A0ABU5IAC3_9BURK|nr:DoxX family membrane protein [Azohydromonas lata]MDZ5455918.1 DoxX family membrane protein [Azohydromonas lata]
MAALVKVIHVPAPALRMLHGLALLGLCAAYLQGGLNKALDFPGAVAEMRHFGLWPAAPMAVAVAVAVIVLELGASLLILSGRGRWLGALLLAAFTLAATFLANRFWLLAPPERFMVENAFFEHLGLVGGFLLVALQDWESRAAARLSGVQAVAGERVAP